MKENFKAILIAVIITSGMLGGVYFFQKNTLGSRTSSGGNSVGGITVTPDQSATTTPTYFTAGTTASSTKELITEFDNNLALDVCLTASTTLTAFKWNIESANTQNSNETWFENRDYTETSDTLRTWAAGKITNTWTPANASASTTCAHLFEPEDLVAVKTRITYNITGANGAVFFRPSQK